MPLVFVYPVSDIPIVTLVLLILINIPDWFGKVLHLAGGIFLLYLAWSAFRTFRYFSENHAVSKPSTVQTFFKAVMINILNPNPYLTWSLVMGPLVIEAFENKPANGISIVAGFYGALLATTAAIILLFGMVRRFGTKVSRILVGISVVALASFGVYQIVLGISKLIT